MPFQFICEWCKQPFTAKRSTTNKGKTTRPRRFCGKRCSAHWRMNNPELKAKRVISGPAREKWAHGMRQWRNRPDVLEKLSRHLSPENNPFHDPEVRRKSLEKLRAKGFTQLNGGNGARLPIPVRMISERLGWPTEVTVPTGKRNGSGNPTCFRIDIANPQLKIAVEADGFSHNLKVVKEADQRKEAYLAANGWTLLRFRNRRILTDFENVIAEITESVKSSILRQVPGTTSLTVS